MNFSIGLRGLADRAFYILLKPFNNALLMIYMLAFQLKDTLIVLEFTIANCAEIFLCSVRFSFIFNSF